MGELERAGFEPRAERVATSAALSEALGRPGWELILSDLESPGFDGLQALRQVRETGLDVPFIFVSSAVGEEAALSALRAGAQDFLGRRSLSRLGLAVERELLEADRRRERRCAEEEASRQTQRAHEELRRTLQLKAEFLQNVSHELRTPLTPIIGGAEVLSELPLGEGPQRMVQLILSSGRRLLELIESLLDLSALERKSLQLKDIPFELPAVLAKAHQGLAAAAAAKGLRYELSVHPGGAALSGDPERLGQVLRELLVNAVKFTEKGSVRLEARPDPAGPPGCWIFTVIDTGVGIPADKRERIFEPFVQGDGSMVRAYPGTGIGLTLARQLARLMGGKLWVESEPDKGSAFHASLPFRPARFPGAEPSARPPGSARRVLVAEDSRDSAALMQILLEGKGHEVRCVGDGLEAVETFMAGAWDLVLMDIHMPRMDGYEATRRIRRWETERGDARAPIVAVTAFTDKPGVERCLEAGCTGHLAKPYNKDELLGLVAEQLAKSRRA